MAAIIENVGLEEVCKSKGTYLYMLRLMKVLEQESHLMSPLIWASEYCLGVVCSIITKVKV